MIPKSPAPLDAALKLVAETTQPGGPGKMLKYHSGVYGNNMGSSYG